MKKALLIILLLIMSTSVKPQEHKIEEPIAGIDVLLDQVSDEDIMNALKGVD